MVDDWFQMSPLKMISNRVYITHECNENLYYFFECLFIIVLPLFRRNIRNFFFFKSLVHCVRLFNSKHYVKICKNTDLIVRQWILFKKKKCYCKTFVMKTYRTHGIDSLDHYIRVRTKKRTCGTDGINKCLNVYAWQLMMFSID